MSVRLSFLVGCLGLLGMNSSAMSQDGAGGESGKSDATIADPLGYFLGFSIAQSLQQQGFLPSDFEVTGFTQGFSDSFGGGAPAMSREQLLEMEGKIQAMLQKRQSELQAAQAAANQEKSELFLAENAKAKGVQTLDGGIQYKVLQEGTGASPNVDDTILVHYTGKHINGEVFDSSVQRGQPMTAKLNQMIDGWKVAVPEMKVGSKWILYIPSALAYGPSGRPPAIEPNEALVFEVELLEIQ
ncbi:MAG: FKBP-type peptidyl-prolyl cis-trans isomerase [Planctomycetota bacterium]